MERDLRKLLKNMKGKDLSTGEKFLLIQLATIENKETTNVELANNFELSRAGLIKIINKLIEKNFLEKSKKLKENGQHEMTIYKLKNLG